MIAKRDEFFDVAKGVGIISVIIGHMLSWSNFTRRFVYIFHLILFFFITGYFYNKKKYQNDPINNVFNKLKNNYPKYVLYSFATLFAHNLFLKFKLISSSYYVFPNFFSQAINILIMNIENLELISGALWFVPVMLVSCSLFGVLVFISNKFQNKKIGFIFLVLSNLFLSFSAIILILNKLSIYNHIHISLLVMPVILLGYLCKNYKFKNKDFKEYLTLPGFVYSLLILVFFLNMYPDRNIDLAASLIFKGKLFYIMVLAGLYMSLSFSKFICKTKIISKVLSYIGKNSFEIMSFHFMFTFVYDLLVKNDFISNSIIFFIVFIIIAIIGSIMIAKIVNYIYKKLLIIINNSHLFVKEKV